MTDESLDLSSLSDEELVEQMHDDLYDGLVEEIARGTRILLDRGWSSSRVLGHALLEGMRIVGDDFRDGILFVPEFLLAADAMKAGIAVLRPLLTETGAGTVWKVLIGTGLGDIGKNLVAMMLDDAAFGVIARAVLMDGRECIGAVDERGPDIAGAAVLPTTTMSYMGGGIDAVVDGGVRNADIRLVGRAPLNEDSGAAVAADGYCRSPAAVAEAAMCLVFGGRRAAW